MKSKAIFLLVIFLLNTVVGFGCALGMEAEHHEEGHAHEESANHAHKDHDHHDATGHEHKATAISGLNFSQEDPCCKTLVNDLVTQSKLIPENGKMQVVLPAMWLFNYGILIPVATVEPDQTGYADKKEKPPNRDIRIVIQSFQI